MVISFRRPDMHGVIIRPADIGLPELAEIGQVARMGAGAGDGAHLHGPRRLEIIYIVSGHVGHRVNGRLVQVQGGDIQVVQPCASHAAVGLSVERFQAVFVILDLPDPGMPFLKLDAAESAALRESLLRLPAHFRGHPSLKGHLAEAIEVYRTSRGQPLTALAVRNHLLAFLVGVCHCSQAAGAVRPSIRIHRVLNRIERQPAEPMPVSRMADLAGMSLSHFKAVFKAEVGMPPSDYARAQRVAAARRLLQERPRCSITAIAMDLGFSSSQKFATVFKRHVGMTPRCYRSRVL